MSILKKCDICGRRQGNTVCDTCFETHYERDVLFTAGSKGVRKIGLGLPIAEKASKEIRKLTRHLWCQLKNPRCQEYGEDNIEELLEYPEGSNVFPYPHLKCPVCKKIKFIVDTEVTPVGANS